MIFNYQFLRYDVNASERPLLSLTRKFVYDILPKLLFSRHEIKVNVSALQQLYLRENKRSRLFNGLKTKVKLIIIGELLKWGYSEARIQHQIKSFSKMNQTKTNKITFKNK